MTETYFFVKSRPKLTRITLHIIAISQIKELLFPLRHCSWPFGLDGRSSIFCDEVPTRSLQDDQTGDAGDAKLLLEAGGEVRSMLNEPPVSVRLLHVLLHVLRGPVRRHEDDLNTLPFDLVVEVLQDWSKCCGQRQKC